MMLRLFLPPRTLAIAMLSGLSCVAAQAQGTSFSSGLSSNISDPLSSNTATTGFDSTFDQSTANLTNPSVHADVSDPTHAQLLGSALSPFANGLIDPQAQTAPQTGVVADAGSAVGYNQFAFGGRRNRSFLPGSDGQSPQNVEARQSSEFAMGGLSMRGAFVGASGMRAAFSGVSTALPSTNRSFSGEGRDAALPRQGLGARALQNESGFPEDSTTYYLSDPVLSGANSGSQTDPELHGDLPSPGEEAAGFFRPAKPDDFNYQYDDGQTPPLRKVPLPGTILGQPPQYLVPAGGFPDSTKGMAASPESDVTRTTFGNSNLGGDTGASPFASISDGLAYSAKTRLNPDLHAIALPKNPVTFEAFERNAQRERYRFGVPISQASAYYQQDLRDYRRSQAHRDQKSDVGDTRSGPGGQQQEIVRRRVIR